jgi:hypothetical protein
VVAIGVTGLRTSSGNPLTRLAPAGENAGCGPPSPPKGRGMGICTSHGLPIQHWRHGRQHGSPPSRESPYSQAC